MGGVSTTQGDKSPCKTNGKKNFEGQCAIRPGAALAKSGVKTTNLVARGRHCWQHETSEGHVLAAEELANGLAKYAIGGIQKKIAIDPSTFQKDIEGKSGIVFLRISGLEVAKVLGIGAGITLIYGMEAD